MKYFTDLSYSGKADWLFIIILHFTKPHKDVTIFVTFY